MKILVDPRLLSSSKDSYVVSSLSSLRISVLDFPQHSNSHHIYPIPTFCLFTTRLWMPWAVGCILFPVESLWAQSNLKFWNAFVFFTLEH
jgi:hypothetical protein